MSRVKSGRWWPWSALAMAVSVAVHVATNAVAIELIPDGWAYWQGAVSMLAGEGFRFFSGHPIVNWPPGYSLYLAAWCWALGSTTTTLSIANGTAVGVQSALWTWCLLTMWAHFRPTPTHAAAAAVAAYVGVLLAVQQQGVGAEVVKYALVAPLFYGAWRASIAPRDELGRFVMLCAAAGALLAVTQHSGIVFVAAAIVLIVSRVSEHPASESLLAAAVVGFVTCLAWFGVRVALNQWDSHPLGWNFGHVTVVDRAREFLQSVSQIAIGVRVDWYRWPAAIAIAATLGAMTLVPRGLWWPLTTFTVVPLALTLALFKLTDIDDGFSQRFVLIAPLLLVPIAMLAAASRVPAPVLAVAAMLIVAPMVMAVRTTATHIRSLDPNDSGDFVMHTREITTQYREGPPQWTGRHWRVAPDPYRGPDRWSR